MGIDEPLLFCLDLQQEFVTPGRPWADPYGDEISYPCSLVLKSARDAGWTIAHSQLHRGAPMMDGPGCMPQSIPGCEPRPGEVLLKRAGISAYAHPDMDELLSFDMMSESRAIRAIMIGFSASTSLKTTLYDARDRGHKLYLLEEAVGSSDTPEWSAEEARALCVKAARDLNLSCTKFAYDEVLGHLPDTSWL